MLQNKDLRYQAHKIWLIESSDLKCQQILDLMDIHYNHNDINPKYCLQNSHNEIVGQPLLKYTSADKVAKRNFSTRNNKCAMLHSLAHIEFNAINLALDAIWRFSDMPTNYYLDWWKVATEEAQHFNMLNQYLSNYGYKYGSFDVHSGLWDMAEKTKHNLIARLAMVPRTLEARGLDMAPIIYEKLLQAKDDEGAKILAKIQHDELEHVLIGNKWYEYLCFKYNLNPITQYKKLCLEYDAPSIRKPFNQLSRYNAGFYPQEIREGCQQLNITYNIINSD